MTGLGPSRATGVFHNWDKAQKTLDHLLQEGFSREQVSIREEKPRPQKLLPGQKETVLTQNQTACSFVGGVLGALLGLLLIVDWILDWSHFFMWQKVGIFLGCTSFGWFLGGWIGSRLSWGKRTQEVQITQDPKRVFLTIHTTHRYEEAIEILRNHGAKGAGSPLV